LSDGVVGVVDAEAVGAGDAGALVGVVEGVGEGGEDGVAGITMHEVGEASEGVVGVFGAGVVGVRELGYAAGGSGVGVLMLPAEGGDGGDTVHGVELVGACLESLMASSIARLMDRRNTSEITTPYKAILQGTKMLIIISSKDDQDNAIAMTSSRIIRIDAVYTDLIDDSMN
jgi:hypothetical protein